MVSRAHRFHGYGSLRRVYQGGKTTRGPLFSIKSVLNEKRQAYRVAVVVSRKVSRSAVDRNRIRRRVYEAVRQVEEAILRPYDIVITVFQDSLLALPVNELSKQVKTQLESAGVLSKRVVSAEPDK